MKTCSKHSNRDTGATPEAKDVEMKGNRGESNSVVLTRAKKERRQTSLSPSDMLGTTSVRACQIKVCPVQQPVSEATADIQRRAGDHAERIEVLPRNTFPSSSKLQSRDRRCHCT